jgi:hypothetical protein
LLLAVTALGIQALSSRIPRDKRMPVFGLIVFFTLFFDTGRLFAPYLQVVSHPEKFVGTGKSLARYRAYLVLKELNAQKGPGWVLGEWDLPADRTLEVATYFFNAAYNPRLNPLDAKWLGVLIDAHYAPFLQKRFPGAQWWDLDSDFSKEGNRMLAVLPVDDSTRGTLLKWARADRAFRDLNWGTDHVHDKDCLAVIDRKIREDYPVIKGDPFLESCFWEKTGQFYYYYGNHFPEHFRAIELALKNGYPAAHLYAKRAELFLLAGNRQAHQETMKKARESEALYPWRNNGN